MLRQHNDMIDHRGILTTTPRWCRCQGKLCHCCAAVKHRASLMIGCFTWTTCCSSEYSRRSKPLFHSKGSCLFSCCSMSRRRSFDTVSTSTPRTPKTPRLSETFSAASLSGESSEEELVLPDWLQEIKSADLAGKQLWMQVCSVRSGLPAFRLKSFPYPCGQRLTESPCITTNCCERESESGRARRPSPGRCMG